MNQSDFEGRLRSAADRFAYPADPPDGLAQTVRRRRALRVALATLATTAAVAVIVAVPVALSRPSAGTTGAKPGPSGAATPTGAAPTPTAHPPSPAGVFPALPAPSPPTDTGTPTTFYASVGAGHERLAVVSTDTGAVQRYLQSTASQALLTYSSDRKIAWQWQDHGCGHTWAQIDLTSGRQIPAFTDLPDPSEIALSPTGQRIAYLYHGAQQMVPVITSTGTVLRPAGCPTAPLTLAVKDTSTGVMRRWSVPNADGHALYLAFDLTATHVAFVDSQQRVRILDINRDTAFDQARPLTTAHPGCQQSKPAYRPGTDQVLVEEMCPSSAAIVGYHANDGELAYSHRVGGRGLIAAFSVDRSGQHLLYSFDPGDNSGNGVVYVVADKGGRDREVTSDIFDLAW